MAEAHVAELQEISALCISCMAPSVWVLLPS